MFDRHLGSKQTRDTDVYAYVHQICVGVLKERVGRRVLKHVGDGKPLYMLWPINFEPFDDKQHVSFGLTWLSVLSGVTHVHLRH